MSKNANGASACVTQRERRDEEQRRQAYEKACSDLSDAIDRAAQTIVIPDDPEDYDDAVVVSSYP